MTDIETFCARSEELLQNSTIMRIDDVQDDVIDNERGEFTKTNDSHILNHEITCMMFPVVCFTNIVTVNIHYRYIDIFYWW